VIATAVARTFNVTGGDVVAANRRDDALIDSLAKQGIGYVPFFPLGGFTPLQSETLSNVAAHLNAKPMSVALAWLLGLPELI
jgi:aryl-alcohol dehydrogenase-like predicted oxidoreductase